MTEHLHTLKDQIPDPTLRKLAEQMLSKTENLLKKVCKHSEIVMFNTDGISHEQSNKKVDFAIRCNICNKELFRISEYKRTIHNISKH